MISVIFPTYNEQDNISALYERLVAVTAGMQEHDFEFVFVDDCSTDETHFKLCKLREKDDRVHLIRFARNCGSHAAVDAGLAMCAGDIAIVLAADLQDPPEIIPRLVAQWEKGYGVVWGKREKRQGEGFMTLVFSRAYYFMMNRLTDVKRPPTGADVVLIDRSVIEAFKQSPEKNSSVFMLIAWLGFSQTYIEYVKEVRHAGISKWTFSKRIKLLFDSLISFSYVPLRFMSLMGAITAFLGVLYALVVFINAFRGIPVQGWATLMIVVLLMGGFQMIMMGMLGEYLWRTYDETRGRPRYVIEKNTFLDSTSDDSSQKKHDKD